MKKIILTLCVCIAFMPSAYAGELYKCIDSKGNPIITNAPQDGMINCVKIPHQKTTLHLKKEQVKASIEELIHDAIQFQAI